jgi:metal-responsive CopG/Arc/MetJ family transcriptional regulator
MSNSCLTKIEVKIPSEWKIKIEKKAEEIGCATVSEAVRLAIREFIEA